ncbi:MAG: protein phosphatase 2C domain-containing protein [Planctomycetaceae bacterium]|jgi:protein phosphatase|nr:protein phosphatase 2C domain-containing protein [Planctomycetaceae bacterium]
MGENNWVSFSMSASTVWKKSIRFAVQTDIGLRRANNQDSHLVQVAQTAKQWLERGHLFVVADGMGAHVAGEVASRLAVETVAKNFISRAACSVQSIVQSLYDAHRTIRSHSRQEAYRSMGTTCDALALTPQGAVIGHVGDSRVYRLRGQTLEQLTFDHSLLWEVCSLTGMAVEEPPEYIPKNQITRSLGPVDNLTVDGEGPLPIEIGDIFLVCSDGLTGQVKDEEIGQILAVFPPDLAVESLINLANLRGGPDNITVAVVQTTESPQESEAVDKALSIPGWHWGVLGFTFLSLCGAAGSIAAGNSFLIMMLAVLTAVSASAFISLTRNTLFGGSPFLPQSAPVGKAPYRTWKCASSPEFAGTLAKLFSELQNAAFCRHFNIRSHEAQHYEAKGTEALKSKNFPEAIRKFLLAINALMYELKKMRRQKQ